MYDNVPEILENGTEYYPPIDSCAYDAHEKVAEYCENDVIATEAMICIFSETIMERRANEL